MANPNIVNVQSIYGKTAGAALVTGGVTILENPAASGLVLKVNSLYVANIDGTNAADVTVEFDDGSAEWALASTVAVAADGTLVVINKTAPLYLEEGQSLIGTASANGDLVAVVSYEEIG